MQEVSGGMWLQFAMGLLIQSWLLKKSIFDPNSDDGVQASWQGPFFSEITCPWNFGTCSGEDMWIYWPRNRILVEYWSPSQLQCKFHKMIDRCITPNASEARKHCYLLRQISKQAIIAGSGEGTMPNPAARSQNDAARAPSRGAASIQVEHHMDP